MITAKELNPKEYELIGDQKNNQENLLYRISVVRYFYGNPMIGTSGVRSKDDHIKIYVKKGYQLKDIPMGSNHLLGAAWDVADKNGTLMRFCVDSENLLKTLGLWIENNTDGWVHFQCLPYGSWRPGKSIFFNP